MNNIRRKNLQAIMEKIDELRSDLEMLKDEEEEYMENMPENLQYTSPRWDAAEEAVQNMEEALSNMEEAINCIESAME